MHTPPDRGKDQDRIYKSGPYQGFLDERGLHVSHMSDPHDKIDYIPATAANAQAKLHGWHDEIRKSVR
jgi:hypothetical protein